MKSEYTNTDITVQSKYKECGEVSGAFRHWSLTDSKHVLVWEVRKKKRVENKVIQFECCNSWKSQSDSLLITLHYSIVP